MARPASQHPTDLELEILKVLWRDGPNPVRHVREALAAAGRELAYTSVMTVMNIMADKGYLKRNKNPRDGGGYVYHPQVKEQATTGQMLRDLVNRAFDCSAAAAMFNLLRSAEVSDEELRQLRELIRRKAKQKDVKPET
jgi:BlaI family penicillinase repressor